MRGLLVVGCFALACSSSTRRDLDPPPAAYCSERAASLLAALPPATELVPPRSLVVAEFAVSRERALRELEARVPRLLGSAKNASIGTAGRVSYQVIRGPLSVGLDQGSFVVRTQVAAEAELCKELGPICIGYGRCSPRFAARVTVPATLDADYSLPPPRVDVAVTRSCEVLGVDARPELERIAGGQAHGARARIERSLPSLAPSVLLAWRALHEPVALTKTSCLRLRPEELLHTPLSEQGGMFLLRVGIAGVVELERPCAARAAAEPGVPPPRATELPRESSLVVSVEDGWAELSAAFARQLAASAALPRIAGVTARSVVLHGESRLSLVVTLDGARCGDVELLATPRWDAAAGGVRLGALHARSGREPELVARLEREPLRLPALDVAAAPRELQRLATTLTEASGVDARLEVRTSRVERVEVSPGGLVRVLRLEGALALSPRATTPAR